MPKLVCVARSTPWFPLPLGFTRPLGATVLAITWVWATLGQTTPSQVALAQQAVQLPTFQQTTVQTSVWVPDGGSTSLGGIGRSAATRTAFGPAVLGPNVRTQQTSSAWGMQTQVQIHDMAELDRQILSQSVGNRPSIPMPGQAAFGPGGQAFMPLGHEAPVVAKAPQSPRPAPPENRSSGLESHGLVLRGAAPPSHSVAEAEAQRATQAAEQQAEAQRYLHEAASAEAAGEPGVARIYYSMALRRATGELKTEAAGHLKRLGR